MKRLAIIGFGAFGRLAAQQLQGRFHVLAHDPLLQPDDIAASAVELAALEEAAAADIVLLTMPVQSMEAAIQAIAPHVLPGATVIDVASVKQRPAEWLMRHIPAATHIVPTHPLFGPQSTARGGLAGRQLVICPVRGQQHAKVAALGEELGLRVRLTTPQEHDREMAYVQALTHLIGRSLAQMAIPDESLKTQSYQHLLDLTELIGTDSFELFSAIQTLNPHAAPVVREFVAHAQALLARVERERD